MEIKSKTKDWKQVSGFQIETGEGLILSKNQQKDLCTFYGIPATLQNVDKKYGTDTLLQVIKVATPEVGLLDGENPQVLDPKSKFYSDEEFDEVVGMFSDTLKADGKVVTKGYSKKITLELPEIATDTFVDDVFHRRMEIERLPQGGLMMSLGLLRLACTNGMMVADKQYRHLQRIGSVDAPLVSTFSDNVSNVNIAQYLETLFSYNGAPISASVAHYRGMRQTLIDIASEDVADLLYPMDYLQNFYTAQNIDIDKMSMKNLEKLPSGLTFYECFNILTNGAKQAERTIENEIKVANWMRPSLFNQLRQSDFALKGTPVFAQDVIRHRMGDI